MSFTNVSVLEQIRARVAKTLTAGIQLNMSTVESSGLRGINIIGADIVCFTPHLDTTRITALNASSYTA
jgi:arginase family enzyme